MTNTNDATRGNWDIVHELAHATQHTSTGASEVQEAASGLATLTNRLQELVKRFKI